MESDNASQSLTPMRSDEGAKGAKRTSAKPADDISDASQGAPVNEIVGNELPKAPAKAKRFHQMTPKRVAAVQRMQEGKKKSLEERRKHTTTLASKLKSASKSIGLKSADRSDAKVMLIEDEELGRIEKEHPSVTPEMLEGIEVNVQEPDDPDMPEHMARQVMKNRRKQEKSSDDLDNFTRKELLEVLNAYKDLAKLSAKVKGGRRRKKADYSDSDSDSSESDYSDYDDGPSRRSRRKSKRRRERKSSPPRTAEPKIVQAEQLQNTAGRKYEMYNAALRSFGSNQITGLRWLSGR